MTHESCLTFESLLGHLRLIVDSHLDTFDSHISLNVTWITRTHLTHESCLTYGSVICETWLRSHESCESLCDMDYSDSHDSWVMSHIRTSLGRIRLSHFVDRDPEYSSASCESSPLWHESCESSVAWVMWVMWVMSHQSHESPTSKWPGCKRHRWLGILEWVLWVESSVTWVMWVLCDMSHVSHVSHMRHVSHESPTSKWPGCKRHRCKRQRWLGILEWGLWVESSVTWVMWVGVPHPSDLDAKCTDDPCPSLMIQVTSTSE